MGVSLAGAQGKTVEDQDKIDDTVARVCAVGIYTKAECRKHTAASEARIKELR